MLKVGRIGFANCTPLFMALSEIGDDGSIELVNGVPTELNRRLVEGGLDLSPSSSVAYLKNDDRLGFLPDLSISSIGEVASVLLFSDVELEKLGGAPLSLTPTSATSVVLTRVLLERFASVTPRYVAGDEECVAELQIGDTALKRGRDNPRRYCYDLGELWYRATGTPFVFALWIARIDSVREKPDEVRRFYRTMIACRQLAYRNYHAYSATAPESQWLGREALERYWATISYDLTDWHMSGLKRFAAEAVSLGVLDHVPELKPFDIENIG